MFFGGWVNAPSPSSPPPVPPPHLALSRSPVALVVTAATYLMLDMYETTALVAVTLALQGAIAAIYPPAINSISIGMVGPYKMADRAARNEIAKHVGGIIAALLPIFFVNDDVGYHYFFLLVAAMALSGIVFVMLIRKEDIDDARARGGGLGAVENAMDIDKAAATPKNVATSMQAVTQEQDRRASLLNGNDVDDDAAEVRHLRANPPTPPFWVHPSRFPPSSMCRPTRARPV